MFMNVSFFAFVRPKLMFSCPQQTRNKNKFNVATDNNDNFEAEKNVVFS